MSFISIDRIDINLDPQRVMREVEQKREAIIATLAEKAATLARKYAPYDTGQLMGSIEAEAIAGDFSAWGVYARTPYALIQEIQQPYLLSACLEVASGRRLSRIVSPHKFNRKPRRSKGSAPAPKTPRPKRPRRKRDEYQYHP
jgi:hypothetical protein